MKQHRGFTLIEVMVVVAIIGILSAIAIPLYSDYVIRSKIVEAKSELSSAMVKMEQYFQDNRRFNDAPGAGTTCGLSLSATPNFTYTCVASNSGHAYVWTASGKTGSPVAGFSFTIDQSNAKGSSTDATAKWPSLNQTGCWISTRGGC